MHAPTTRPRSRRPRRLLVAGVALLVAGTAALAGCSSSGGARDAAASAANLATGLEPQPLAEPTELTVSMGLKAEAFSAMLLADALGELKKENITVNYVTMPSTDALPALAQGKVDVAAAGLTSALFNGIDSGAGIRLAYPGPSNNTADGLWLALDPATGKPASVESVGISSGAGSTAVVPIARYLETVGGTIDDVEFTKLPIEDLPMALENGAVTGAWLNAPAQAPVEEWGQAEHVAWYGPGEYGTGYLFGPNLLDENPAAAQAFVRALVRTSQTYLTGDYKQDADVVSALATSIGVTPEDILETPSLTFDPALTTELFDRAQQIWIALGGDLVSYDEPMTPDQYTEPGFLDRAIGTA